MQHIATVNATKRKDKIWIVAWRDELTNTIQQEAWISGDRAKMRAWSLADSCANRHNCGDAIVVRNNAKHYCANVWAKIDISAYDIWALQTGSAK